MTRVFQNRRQFMSLAIRYLAIAVPALGVMACAESRSPTDSSAAASNSITAPSSAESVEKAQTLDDQFARVAAIADGFAGAYLDSDGALVIGLTDTTQSATARDALSHELGASVRVSPSLSSRSAASIREVSSRLRVLNRRFTFDQLLAWKRAVAADLMGLDGVVSIDVDERMNAIAIGTESASWRNAAAAIVRKAGVPDAAVQYALEQKAVLTRQTVNLGYRQRPLTGGFVVGPIGCTMTGTAYRGFEPLLITASHCSAQSFSLDGGPTFQGNGADTWGFETTDPSLYTCGPFNTRRCRRADVTAYNVSAISTLPADTLSFMVGLIARTQFPSNGLTQTPGSRDIDQSTPYWYIQAERNTVLAGMTLHKVGNATGWTYGDVFGTCVDRQFVGNIWIVCSDRATIFANEGDSGSPVFIINNSVGVTFVGLLWGKDANTSNVNVSNLTQIKQDLGNVRFF